MTTTQRPWVGHFAAASAIVGAGVLALVGSAMWVLDLAVPCAPDYSESTVVAPDSDRGRLLCAVSDGELTTSPLAVWLLALVPAAALLVAVLLWVRRRRLRPVLLACVVAVLLPWGVRLAVQSLPADCSPEQLADHGSAGCERSEEERPGFGQY
jgi:hypothetical protein